MIGLGFVGTVVGIVGTIILQKIIGQYLWPKVKKELLERPHTSTSLPEKRPYYMKDQSYFDKVDRAFQTGRVAVVQGFGGIGKTTFAIEYGHYVKDFHQYDVRWFDVALTDALGYKALAKELGIEVDIGTSDEQIKNQVHAKIENKKVLLIMDNVDDYSKVSNYVASSPSNVKILITSREKIKAHISTTIQLKEFTEDQVKKYIKAVLKNSVDEQDIIKLAAKFGKLPIRLAWIVKYLQQHKATLDVDAFIKEYEVRL